MRARAALTSDCEWTSTPNTCSARSLVGTPNSRSVAPADCRKTASPHVGSRILALGSPSMAHAARNSAIGLGVKKAPRAFWSPDSSTSTSDAWLATTTHLLGGEPMFRYRRLLPPWPQGSTTPPSRSSRGSSAGPRRRRVRGRCGTPAAGAGSARRPGRALRRTRGSRARRRRRLRGSRRPPR